VTHRGIGRQAGGRAGRQAGGRFTVGDSEYSDTHRVIGKQQQSGRFPVVDSDSEIHRVIGRQAQSGRFPVPNFLELAVAL